jgi:hypothetical protein
MRTNGYIFSLICVFCAGADIVYWFTSKDPTGTAALGITGGLAFLIGFYLLVTAHRLGLQPMDNTDGEISDAAGVVGHFSPSSWWPILIAVSGTVTVFGFVFGIWLAMLGLAGVFGTVTGLLFENLHDPTPPSSSAAHH